MTKICFIDGALDYSKFDRVHRVTPLFSYDTPPFHHAMDIVAILRRHAPDVDIYHCDAIHPMMQDGKGTEGIYESELANAMRTIREEVEPPYVLTFSFEADFRAAPALTEELNWLEANGCILVCCAGNSGMEIPVMRWDPRAPTGWPANDPRTVIVGGLWDHINARVDFSDWTWSGRRMMFAKATNIEGYNGSNLYGTSFAAPMVAARIANVMKDTGLWGQAAYEIVWQAGEHINVDRAGSDTYSVLTDFNGPVRSFMGKKFRVDWVKYLELNPDIKAAMKKEWFEGPHHHARCFGWDEVLKGLRSDKFCEEIGE